MDIQSRLEDARSIINAYETLFLRIINMVYWFITFYFPFLKISTSFRISQVIVKYEKDIRLLRKEQNIQNVLVVKDHGIDFYTHFIPYERLYQVGFYKSGVYIVFIGDIVYGDKNVVMKDENNGYVYVSFKLKNPKQLWGCIKSNMYYHFKYNKINEKVLEQIDFLLFAKKND
jgi:hypothetical protein